MPKIKWNPEKNTWLKANRQVSCEDVAKAIEKNQVIKIEDHHNQTKYAKQKLVYFKHEGYIFVAPCVIKNDEIFIKTIYASRKATKKLLRRSI